MSDAQREAFEEVRDAAELRLSNKMKRDWIANHYSGSYEMFIDPIRLYDRIDRLVMLEAALARVIGQDVADGDTDGIIARLKVIFPQIEEGVCQS